jgi:cytochrome oxidase Cu insertion factor (SCO1/SenC/PrrC family)
MNPPVSEPAVIDPAKLRRTAWFLVAIMIAGGFLILKSYEKMAVGQSKDNRPAMIHQIRKERDLTVIRQNGQTAPLFDLRGKVVAMHCISLGEPERAKRTLAVMERLSRSLEEFPDLQLITLVIDPPAAEETVRTLRETAENLGVALPHWWLATTEEKTLHKFIRNELKTTIPPHKTAEGWQFETSVFLMDRNGHLRRAVVPQQRGGPPFIATFDFDQAADWDTKGVKTGTDLTNERQLEKLLRETIGLLLAEPATAP